MPKTLVSVVGPTAIGKTALAITLANHFDTEIISADSRQFFKEMTIGTAAPTPTELAAAKHNFIHHKSVEDDYNVGEFEKDALQLLDELFLHKDIVIMVGGSGLYVDAVINGLDDFPKIDSSIRESLNNQLKNNGLQHLQNQLEVLDIDTYKNIAIDNPKRVIRALEICLGTGKPYSTFLNKDKSNRNFNSIIIGLSAGRDVIYERINSRVDNMMAEGLLEEVKTLLTKQHLNSLNTVGYKELFNYLEGIWTLDFAISEIKKNSRRYAKRQLTWFKKNKNIVWYDFECDPNDIIKNLETTLKGNNSRSS